MAGRIIIICLGLLTHTASLSSTIIASNIASSSTTNPSSVTSSATIKPSSTTNQFGFLSPKPPSSYQVTEDVIDIPDDRTLSPILTNFGFSKPLNIANTSISVNEVIKNDTGDESNQPKRTSFTYVHFTKDEEKKEIGITKLFRGIKDYVYNLKKGVVDGLHNYFHRDDKKNDKGETFHDKFQRSNDFDKNDGVVEFHHKFHSSYDSDENFDDYEYDHEDYEHEVKD